MSTQYVCVHGHFYQPPRENPWLEEIEREESAEPFHDWNERITHEAYAPNAFSRVLDDRGAITRIVNNYGWMSFNFGPTLLAWMERKAPETYEAVLEADRKSQERFSGHGSALAQAYNHTILPLSLPRDLKTQVHWGIRDFEHRFGRSPEGMWLPETAVDRPTLQALAEAGIRFTILAPRQVASVRPPGGEWTKVRGDELDTTRPYRVRLDGGHELAVFFYHGPLARAVAFERLLSDGVAFARRLMGDHRSRNGLTHIATDGETYGHHHRHGEMGLSAALELVEETEGVELTNYAEYLERHPPEWEATVKDGTSWSCAHGVERWRSDCGCSTGAHPEWSQKWREPLRQALDDLRGWLDPLYGEAAGELLSDPWGARDRYIDVVLDRGAESVRRFLDREGNRVLRGGERARALRLLELQRHAMLVYTSCGWFFDDLSGLETLQVLKYAARALHLAEGLLPQSVEEAFLDTLDSASSNVPDGGSGRELYEAKVRPLQVGLSKVAAHHAVSTLFDNGEASPDGERTVYCYSVQVAEERRVDSGRARLGVGRVRVASRITATSAEVSYAFLHLGDQNLVGGVRKFQTLEAYRALTAEVLEAFESGDYPQVIRTLDREFRAETYSLHSLFRDEQERIVELILDESLAEAEDVLVHLYESRAPLMGFLARLSVAQPAPFKTAGEFVVGTRLRRALASDPPDVERARSLVAEARRNRLRLAEDEVAYRLGEALHRLLEALQDDPADRGRLDRVLEATGFLAEIPYTADLWWAQNHYFRILEEVYPVYAARASKDREAARWLQDFRTVGWRLNVAVPKMGS